MSEKSKTIDQLALEYLNYLSNEGFNSQTHSALPESISKDAKELNVKLEAFNPPECIKPFNFPIFNVCCTSKLAQSAMAAGFFLGMSSVYVGFATNLSTQTLIAIGGALAGIANCSGTYLGMLDTTLRSHAEDRQQDLYLSIKDYFQNLALILLMEYLSERKERLLNGLEDVDATINQELVKKILANEKEIRLSIKNYFSTYPKDQLSRPIENELFEALHFISTGEIPNSEILINQIMTFNSPSMEEFIELKKKFTDLTKEMEAIQSRLKSGIILSQPTENDKKLLKCTEFIC